MNKHFTNRLKRKLLSNKYDDFQRGLIKEYLTKYEYISLLKSMIDVFERNALHGIGQDTYKKMKQDIITSKHELDLINIHLENFDIFSLIYN